MSRPLHVSTGTPVVIDSSVVFKWFDRSEAGADAAVALAQEHGRDETALIAPAHMLLEVANALASRRTPIGEAEAAMRLLGKTDLLIAPVDDVLLVDSLRIAHEERLALCDAVFIALAARLDAELVTADRRQGATKSCRVRLIGV
jgi:predicted nucleic acid-binding protein